MRFNGAIKINGVCLDNKNFNLVYYAETVEEAIDYFLWVFKNNPPYRVVQFNGYIFDDTKRYQIKNNKIVEDRSYILENAYPIGSKLFRLLFKPARATNLKLNQLLGKLVFYKSEFDEALEEANQREIFLSNGGDYKINLSEVRPLDDFSFIDENGFVWSYENKHFVNQFGDKLTRIIF